MSDLFDSSYNVEEKGEIESKFSSIIAILFIRRLQMNGLTKRMENTHDGQERGGTKPETERERDTKRQRLTRKDWSGDARVPVYLGRSAASGHVVGWSYCLFGTSLLTGGGRGGPWSSRWSPCRIQPWF